MIRLTPILLGGALVLAATGAAAQPATPPPDPPPAPIEAPTYRNDAMRIAGIVLTSLGSAVALAGLTIFAGDMISSHGEGDHIAGYLIGLPLMGGSVLFAAHGIPLWVLGARPPERSAASAWPSLAVGGGSGSLRWSF